HRRANFLDSSSRLLWRHVTGRPQHIAIPRPSRAIAVQTLGQAKVGNLGTKVREQNVRGLKIAMDDLLLVSVLYREGQRMNQFGRFFGRPRLPGQAPVQTAALD